MNRTLLWRGLLILAVLATALYVAYPPEEKINLGLDLKGGMHLVLQVHTADALRAETDSDMDRLLQLAKDEDVTGATGRRTGDSTFEIAGLTPESADTLSGLVSRFGYNNRWNVSRQGDRMVFSMLETEANAVRESAVNQARQTIDNRINAYGVAEPVIVPASGYRIDLQLPGVDDPERVRNLIKSTAFLEFRLVRFPKGGGGVSSREEILANYGGQLPENLEILEGDIRDDQGNKVGEQFYAVDKVRTVTGRDLKTARPGLGQFRDPIVEFSLTPTGADAFARLTGENVGSGLAIVLDGRVVSAPVINSQIRDNGLIEGSFTQQEAQDLATVLK